MIFAPVGHDPPGHYFCLARIGGALGVRTKRLYDEGEGQEAGPAG